MSINLKNLKDGQTRTATVNGTEVQVSKNGKAYGFKIADQMWAAGYSAANKNWVVSTPSQDVITLNSTTASLLEDIVVTATVEATDLVEAAAEPSKELAIIEPAGELELAADVVEAEIVEDEDEDETPTQLDYDVDTKGGHSPHRLTALATIANAAGAAVDKHVIGGWNGSVTLTALVPANQVEALTDILQRFEAAVEPLAAVISKQVSNQARSEGRHHSGPGCHARRGYIRGFADAVAGKINPEAELEGDFGQNLKYDHDAYLKGLMAGEAFSIA